VNLFRGQKVKGQGHQADECSQHSSWHLQKPFLWALWSVQRLLPHIYRWFKNGPYDHSRSKVKDQGHQVD